MTNDQPGRDRLLQATEECLEALLGGGPRAVVGVFQRRPDLAQALGQRLEVLACCGLLPEADPAAPPRIASPQLRRAAAEALRVLSDEGGDGRAGGRAGGCDATMEEG